MINPGDVITNPRTGQRMKFLLTGRETNGEMLQIDCTNAPSGVKEPEHIHPFQENRFQIISGTLMFRIAGKEQHGCAGDVISIPPKVPHFFWNAGAEEAHYIQEFHPALQSDFFFETLFALARDGQLNDRGLPNVFQMAMLVPYFWNEIRVTQPPEIIQRVFCTVLAPASKLLGYRGVRS